MGADELGGKFSGIYKCQFFGCKSNLQKEFFKQNTIALNPTAPFLDLREGQIDTLLNLSAVLVAFWSLDMHCAVLNKVLLCIETLLSSLARHNVLLMGKAMVPYFLTFVLGPIHEHEGLIEHFAQKFDKQIQHCIYFAYGIKLPLVELGHLSYTLGEIEVPETGFRAISLIGEIQAIWSYCDKAFYDMKQKDEEKIRCTKNAYNTNKTNRSNIDSVVRKIDKICRMLFPIAFIMFNVTYWICLTNMK